jgi:hypothetical protein
MAIWTISPRYKKSVIERTYYFKDGKTLCREEGWRWATFSGEFDEQPNVDLENDSDLDIAAEDGWDLDEMDDGCWLDWSFPEDMSDEEQEQILNVWDEEYDLTSLGWTQDEYECWFTGPLVMTDEDGNKYTSDTDSVSESNPQPVKLTESIQSTPTTAWPFPTQPIQEKKDEDSKSN